MTNQSEKENLTRRVAEALTAIGIVTRERSDAGGFLERVSIHQGEIHYRPNAPASNLLHEAGHLACLPPAFRKMANDDLMVVFDAMGEALEERMDSTGNPDDPLIRAIMQCSDPEATAWAWAFGVSMGLPPEAIILDDEYDGDGASVRIQVSTNNHPGINGLRAAGMIHTTRQYPRMDKWLQDAV